MNLNRNLSLAAFAAVATLALGACNNDDDDDPVAPVNEEELITTVNVNYTGGGSNGTMTFRDIDGPGGTPATVTPDTVVLQANTAYEFTTTFRNESADPVEETTDEIREEATDHQVFYLPTGFTGTVGYEDEDSDKRPIGLEATFATGDAAVGTLRVVLRHQPDKAGAGVSDGNIDNAGGETDVQVDFPVKVE